LGTVGTEQTFENNLQETDTTASRSGSIESLFVVFSFSIL